MVAGGMFWFSRLTRARRYASHLLGPQLVSSFGLGLVFVPMALVALDNGGRNGSGVASSLLNAAQQVGGAVGLALLDRVAWTAVADSVRPRSRTRRRPPRRRAAIAEAGHHPAGVYLRSRPDGRLFPCVRCCRGDRAARPAHRDRHHPGQPPGTGRWRARAARGGTAARSIAVPGIALPGIALLGIALPAPQPATVQRHEDRATLAAAARPRRLFASRHVITTWKKSAGTTPGAGWPGSKHPSRAWPARRTWSARWGRSSGRCLCRSALSCGSPRSGAATPTRPLSHSRPRSQHTSTSTSTSTSTAEPQRCDSDAVSARLK